MNFKRSFDNLNQSTKSRLPSTQGSYNCMNYMKWPIMIGRYHWGSKTKKYKKRTKILWSQIRKYTNLSKILTNDLVQCSFRCWIGHGIGKFRSRSLFVKTCLLLHLPLKFLSIRNQIRTKPKWIRCNQGILGKNCKCCDPDSMWFHGLVNNSRIKLHVIIFDLTMSTRLINLYEINANIN